MDIAGDGRTDSYGIKTRQVDRRGQDPIGIVEEKSRHRGLANMWRRMETPSGTAVSAPRAPGHDRSSLLRHERTQECKNALE
jgi:hypothetical protein